FFPRRYLDYNHRKAIAELTEGEQATIFALVWEARQVSLGQRRSTEAIVGDDTGNIRAVWFNQPYLAAKLSPNQRLVLSGRVSTYKGMKVMESPDWEVDEGGELTHVGRLVPLYPLTEGLYPRQFRQLMKDVVEGGVSQVVDFLPPEIKQNRGLLDLSQALAQTHFPQDSELLTKARRRLAFDEFFLFQIGIVSRRRQWQAEMGHAFKPCSEMVDGFIRTLPFKLTAAQERVLAQIMADMGKPTPMARLLQGEVGSGKTVVAAIALLLAVANGYQGAMMAPTEVLAEQHFDTLGRLLSRMGREEGEGHWRSYSGLLPRPLSLALFTGSLRPAEKEDLRQRLARGEIDLAVGTHALIQREVEMPSLGLAVVDEQHRFGVLQRAALRQKGFNPHLLVMTATPIPRSLALSLYGDMDLSIINELPPGRPEVKTRRLEPKDRQWVYDFIRQEVTAGNRAFIICPIIEESEVLEVKAAAAEYARLSQEVFPLLRLGLLHGRLSLAEKEDVMRRFKAGELSILVSTPVVEVGVDVPQATVMLIEGAERFGLSQLHQFRGRIGRGERPSYCFLLAENPTPEAQERLAIVEREKDGLVLAEEDLRLRGPGEFFGTRQSGLACFKLARLSDVDLLEAAREDVLALLGKDSDLRDHPLLAQEAKRYLPQEGEWS
ncbi:MAG: ATP-dependent DNA helicase RecG, partial [Chloroflexota bacterium]